MNEKKTSWNGEEVEILTVDYEPGRPAQPERWNARLRTRKAMLNYIESAERYWSDKEGFGSEKRKNPA